MNEMFVKVYRHASYVSTENIRRGGRERERNDGYTAENKNRDRTMMGDPFIRYSEDEPIGSLQPRLAFPSFSIKWMRKIRNENRDLCSHLRDYWRL